MFVKILRGKTTTKTLNEKKIAFKVKDQLERKSVQSKLRKQIREAKKQYKEKAEFQFQTGNMRDAWKHKLDTPGLN